MINRENGLDNFPMLDLQKSLVKHLKNEEFEKVQRKKTKRNSVQGHLFERFRDQDY